MMTQSAGCQDAARAASRVLRLLCQNEAGDLGPALDRLCAHAGRRAPASSLETERWDLLTAVAASLRGKQPRAGLCATEVRLLQHLALSNPG